VRADLGGRDVRCRRTLRALAAARTLPSAPRQRLGSRCLDGGVMHEHHLTAVVRGNKAEPLAVVKPLHGSLAIEKSLLFS